MQSLKKSKNSKIFSVSWFDADIKEGEDKVSLEGSESEEDIVIIQYKAKTIDKTEER